MNFLKLRTLLGIMGRHKINFMAACQRSIYKYKNPMLYKAESGLSKENEPPLRTARLIFFKLIAKD